MPNIRELSFNERRLVELVFTSKNTARIDLAKKSGMTGASVTRLVAGLMEIGIFEEYVDKAGLKGQPKKMLKVKVESFVSAGITFSVARMNVALVNLGGKIIDSRSININTTAALDVTQAAHKAINEMCQKLNITVNDLIGVGCSIPGNFGISTEDVKAHPRFPAFQKGEATHAFSSTFDIPYVIENDGTAAALGEYVFGKNDKTKDTMFLIHIGHGVGGGAIIRGQLYRGVHGNACLPGVLFPYDEPRPSGQDLIDTLTNEGIIINEFDDILSINDKNQIFLEHWTQRAGLQLRHAARVITGFFDPTEIVIGGRLPDVINQKLVDQILSTPIAGPSLGLPIAEVRASTLGIQGGAIGAACLPLFMKFFSGTVPDTGNFYLNGRK